MAVWKLVGACLLVAGCYGPGPGRCALDHGVCLRYRSEDSACPLWCVQWSNASCWEAQAAPGDCDRARGYDCYYPGGEDLAPPPCVDAASTD
jgi:hypothetical protein